MKLKNLEFLTFSAVLLAVIAAVAVPEYSYTTYFFGRIYIHLLKMLVLPIVITSLLLAFAKFSSLLELKDIGFKTVLYYIFTSSMALLLGISLSNIFSFNRIASSQVNTINTDIDIVERLFSTNIFESLAQGEMLQIVVVSIMVGIAIASLNSETKKPIVDLVDSVYQLLLKLINWILIFTPLAVFALLWKIGSEFNLGDLKSMGNFFVATGLGASIHALLILPLIAFFLGRFNAYKFLKTVRKPLLVSLASASSSATLPVSIDTLEKSGLSKKTTRFVLPLGATLNMDGSALYQGVLTMFFVSLSGVQIGLQQQIIVFLLILLSSAGTAGIPSGGIVMMTLVLSTLEIPNPDYYLGIYLVVDRFWDYPITTVNVWGDLIGAKTVDRWIKRTEDSAAVEG